MLISLAENLFTTYYFDEDKFGVITIALIFCFEPILDSCVKQLMNCTECSWDNFLYDLISEGLQCFLYIHFCDYTDLSRIAIPAMMAAQVFLIILLKVKEVCCSTAKEETDEQKEAAFMAELLGWIQGNCMTLCTGLLPLLYLLYQEEAPYRQKPFEMALAGYYWTQDVALQYNLKALKDSATEKGQQKVAAIMMNKSKTLKFTQLAQLAFSIYGMVLAWQYWFSPEIDAVFDKVFTMFSMVMSVCVGICLPCAACQIICGAGMNGGAPGGVPADVFGNADEGVDGPRVQSDQTSAEQSVEV